MLRENNGPVLKSNRLELAGQSLFLHPYGAVFWEELATLFVADLHLGKSTTFRRNGIPIPAGATTETIVRMVRCIDTFAPERLVVLGDLVHAKCSWDDELLAGLSSAVNRIPKNQFILLEGNHDRGSRSRWDQLSIQRYEAPYEMPPWTLLHDEANERPGRSKGESNFLAGHLHPAVKLVGMGESLRLRCFTLYDHCLTLPAFGVFTGSKIIEPRAGERIYAIVENEVIPLER